MPFLCILFWGNDSGREYTEPDAPSYGRLRRSAATGMASIGIAPHVVDKILNHSTGKISGIAAIYNRFGYLPERKDALERWSEHVEELIWPTWLEDVEEDISPTASNIIEMPRRAEA